jgi:hypothetical protein
VLDAGRVVAEGPTEGLANESVRKLLAV